MNRKSLWNHVLACPLPAPQHPCWQGSARSWNILGSVQALPCNTYNIGVLPALFSSYIQNTALCQLLGRKLTPSQKTGHLSNSKLCLGLEAYSNLFDL